MVRKPTTIELRKERFQRPQRAWKKLRALLKSFEDQKYIKYNKVLGFGGFGLVLDWDVLKPDGSRERGIAMKTCVDKNHKSTTESLKREIFYTKKFTGCEHLMQLVDLDPRLMRAARINTENTFGESPNIVMEKLGRGSLRLLLSRLHSGMALNQNLPENLRVMEYIPNRTLWSIFLCLARGVIGMAFVSNDPLSRKGRIIRETTQNIMPSQPTERLIHSDIDVGNIFVADPLDYPPDAEHRWAPVVKIADYGCMIDWRDDWSPAQKMRSLWGKNAYKAPEQFYPRCFQSGVVGPMSNIYQIGQAMHDLVTLRLVKFDMRTQMQRFVNDILMNTYGWRVLRHAEDYPINDDFLNTDGALRELIAGCMAEEAYNRPTPHALERIITERIRELDRRADIARRAAVARQTFNPEARAFVPGQALRTGLNPASREFVPGQQGLPIGSYRNRVPQGMVEPDWLLQKFYRDYFLADWEDPDMYEGYWDKKTLTPYVSEMK